MLNMEHGFQAFQKLWRNLPRRAHPLLPCKNDITPALFGELLPHMCLGDWRGPEEMFLLYAGSGFERNAGFDATGRNYYEQVPAEFRETIKRFHSTLFTMPCGAYIGDVVSSTMGGQYMHYTLHLPVADEDGIPRFLVVFGLDRKPAFDVGQRAETSVAKSSIRDLSYLDLGAGAPPGYIANFKRIAGTPQLATQHSLAPDQV